MQRTRKPLMLLAALLAIGSIAPVLDADPGRLSPERSRAIRRWLERGPDSCPEPATLQSDVPRISKTVLALSPPPVSSSCGPLYLSGEMTVIAQAFVTKRVAHLVGGGGLGGFHIPCIGCPKQPIFPVNVQLGDTWINIFPGGPPSDVPVVVRVHPCKEILIVGTLHVAFKANGQLDASHSSLEFHGSVNVPPL